MGDEVMGDPRSREVWVGIDPRVQAGGGRERRGVQAGQSGGESSGRRVQNWGLGDPRDPGGWGRG